MVSRREGEVITEMDQGAFGERYVPTIDLSNSECSLRGQSSLSLAYLQGLGD